MRAYNFSSGEPVLGTTEALTTVNRRKDQPITVLLVDDHTLVRQGIVEILRTDEGLLVVGEAANGAEAVDLCAKTKPDVALLDVEMPIMGAEQAIGRISIVSPSTKVVICTMYDDSRLVRRLLESGASAYVIKSAAREELVAAIRTAAADEGRVQLSISQDTLNELRKRAETPLSARELEVLVLAARGMSNQQIARDLRLSQGTVKRHMANINGKLRANSRGEATSRAISEGWITPRDVS